MLTPTAFQASQRANELAFLSSPMAQTMTLREQEAHIMSVIYIKPTKSQALQMCDDCERDTCAYCPVQNWL